MTQVLSNFIRALRAADVRVSTAESIDAAAVLEIVGFDDRTLVRDALSQALAKSIDDKQRFDECFERYFRFEDVQSTRSRDGEAAQDDEGTAPMRAAEEGSAAGTGSAAGGGSGESLVSILERGDDAALQQRIAAAAVQVQLANIRFFTQRGIYLRRILEHIGLQELEDAIDALSRRRADAARAARLEELRARLIEQVGGVVERQMLMYTANAGQRLREEILQKTALTRLEHRDFRVMQALIRKLAKRLVALHSRRRHVARRGKLDVRHTIRRNIEYDGLLFETVWKKVRVDRPKVIAVCDVSGSVAKVARFLLLFLYSVTEVIPKVRAFAFSGRLGEVTDLFARSDVEEAIERTLHDWGHGSTDYGAAFAELERLAGDEVDHRTTVLILGDARSNYGDPGDAALRRIHERARRVIWLNPEPRTLWNYGDSVMRKLGASCDRVEACRSVTHLERIVSEIARTAI
ncbi:MAG: VWA domain-containing protein [Gammaproteobacteria bacterium]